MLNNILREGISVSVKSNKTQPTPIRLDEALLEKVAYASDKTGLPKQDIMRLCMAMGLEDLRRLDYNIVGVLSAAANPAPATMSMLRVAEDPVVAKYPKGKGAK